MAVREVEADEFAPFVKKAQVFAKVGNKFAGIYKGNSENPNGYGTDYRFVTNIGEITLTLKGRLDGQLKKANLTGGELVVIQRAADKNVGKESPMQTYKVQVDDEWGSKPAPKNGPNVALPVRESAPAVSEDEIPF